MDRLSRRMVRHVRLVVVVVLLSYLWLSLPHSGSLAWTQEAPEATTSIDLGHVIVHSGPPLQPLTRGELTAQTPLVGVRQPVSLAEAQATVDFPIVQPTWLPTPAYQLWEVQLFDGPGGKVVTLIYRDTTVVLGQEPPREVVLLERRWVEIGSLTVPVALSLGSIAGQPAAFWTLMIAAPALPDGAVTRLMAAWERDELFIEFNTAGISMEQLVQVAASLTE